jgi:hypothetical protein
MTKVGKIFLWVIVLVAVVLVIYFLGRDVKDENVIDKTLPAYNYENEILGKKEDLLSFTILPGTKVPNGILSYRGSIKGAWFFEGVSHHDRRITEYCQACCVDFIRSVTGDEINERDKANFFWCVP